MVVKMLLMIPLLIGFDMYDPLFLVTAAFG